LNFSSATDFRKIQGLSFNKFLRRNSRGITKCGGKPTVKGDNFSHNGFLRIDEEE